MSEKTYTSNIPAITPIETLPKQFVLDRTDMSTSFSDSEYQACLDAITAGQVVAVNWIQGGVTRQLQLVSVSATGILKFSYVRSYDLDTWTVTASSPHSITHESYDVDPTNFAPAEYGTDQVKNLPTSITSFRTGDYIAVDGPSGTAKMAKDDLLRVTAENVTKAGKNLWNNNDVYVGFIKNDGTLETGLTSYRSSGYIPIKPSTNYYASKINDAVICGNATACFAFYDADKVFISAIASNTKSFTTPATAKYARFSSYKDNESPTIQIEEGNGRTSFAEYTPIGGFSAEKYVDWSIGENAFVNPKVTKKAGKNIFNKDDISVGYIRSNGTFDTGLTSYRASGYIEVKASTDYYASKPNDSSISGSTGTYIAFYDGNKNFISSVTATTKSFTTPATCVYLRATASYDTSLPYVQIEEGSARTMFVPYTPIGGYNAESYTEGSIPDTALQNLKASEKAGKNIFNKDDIYVGFIKNNGTLDTGLTGYRSSGFLAVDSSTAYYASKPNNASISESSGTYIAYYDDGKTFISAVTATTKSLMTPATAKFMRVSVTNDANLKYVQIEKGTARSLFEEFNPVGGYHSELYADYSVPDKAIKTLKVNAKAGKNLFDKDAVVVGFMTYSGEINSGFTNYRVSDYIEVSPLTAYHMSTGGDDVVCFNTNTYIGFYDENRTILQLIQSNVKDITTPANTKYVRFSIYYDASTLPTIQFELGSARTDFEEYSPIAGYGKSNDELNDRKYYQRVVPRILPVTKMAAICFVFDDGVAKDDDVVTLFDSYGVRCGFALPWGTYSVNNRMTKYQHYQRIGFSCLNHTGERLDSYADEAEANAVVAGGKFNLEKNGFCINGWVCPENVYVTAYRSMLGKYHGYAFGDHGDGDKNTTATDILRLRRYSLENSAVTLNAAKDLIDGAIANGYMYCFYGHSSNIGGTGYNNMQFWIDVLEYVIAKRDDGYLFFDNPDNVVKYYFDL